MQEQLKQLEEQVAELFLAEYGTQPQALILSPGRVNIIGEHTDYNDGFVLPMAIDRYLVMAIARRDDQRVRVLSTDFDERIEFDIAEIKKGEFEWGEYITGSVQGLADTGVELKGFDLVITANIPVGASLSSSAALELGTLRAASWSAGAEWNALEMARLGQKVENEWVGMNCGIMDQAICACGKQDHAMMIDCRDLDMTPCPLPAGSSIVVLDTTTRRGLVDSAYNERREQCFNAAEVMGVEILRDASSAMLESCKAEMDELTYKRAKHVIDENGRVEQARQAMKENAGYELGRLMYRSHVSLRDDFDVSGKALNVMVEYAMQHPSCLGARMTGAGFAGCAVALVKKGQEREFVADVAKKYAAEMDVEPRLYVCRASDGTSVKEL